MPTQKARKPQKTQQKEGFFQKITGLFLGSADPESGKRRELKKIAKEINRQKFKWYKTSSGEILPQMGRFFYDIYATVGPSRGILSNANESAALKMIVVEESLSQRQREIKEGLSEERLKERAEKEGSEGLEAKVKKELSEFQREFTTEKTKSIDHVYSQIEEFCNFVMFDYYFLIKKFDPSMPEAAYSYTPKCEPIRGEYALDDLRDFAAVAYGLPLNADWKAIFSMIKQYKGTEPAVIARWTKVVRSVGDARKSNIIPLIIRHIGKNPVEQVKPVTANARIVEDYISRLRGQTEGFLKKIVQEAKTSKASQLAKMLFGIATPECLQNYTAEASSPFKQKGYDGFLRAAPLNFLAAFLTKYLKTDITEITDLCLVRGQWLVQEDTVPFSNSYHALIDLQAKIKEFDSSLAQDAPLGAKLKSLLMRQEHDREARSQLKTYLNDANREALSILTESAQNLVVIGKDIKLLADDCGKQPHKMLANWKEIESVSRQNVSTMLLEGYKKVYAIVKLLQIYLKSGSKKEE